MSWQVVGATNRIKLLDEALLRPGRFDRTIYMGRPSTNNRFKILQARRRPLARAKHCAAYEVDTNVQKMKPLYQAQSWGRYAGMVFLAMNQPLIVNLRSRLLLLRSLLPTALNPFTCAVWARTVGMA